MELVVIPVPQIEEAIDKAIAKHGPMPTDPLRMAGILCEEAGEVMAEALKITNPTGAGSHRGAAGTVEAMRQELYQVAGTACMILNNLAKQEAEREIECSKKHP